MAESKILITALYTQDKETKGSYRFATNHDDLSGASLYIRKDVCKKLGIVPGRGFLLTISDNVIK